jgi:membrane protein YqaA with SNARE-associated domain
VVETVLKTQLLDLIGLSVAGTVLGAVVGFALGILGYFALKRVGGYDWGWAHAKWLRRVLAVVMALAGAATGAFVGLVDGSIRGFEQVLRESQLATEVFPVAGDFGADLVAALYVEVPRLESGKDAVYPKQEVQAFRKGEWEVDVAKLAALTSVEPERVATLVTALQEEALSSFPSWRGGSFERILNTVLVTLSQAIVATKGRGIGLRKVTKIMRKAIDALPSAAKKSGDPNTIGRENLSEHVVQFGVVPVLMWPVRSTARTYELLAILGLVLGSLLGAGMFRLAERIRTRNRLTPPTPGPTPTA